MAEVKIFNKLVPEELVKEAEEHYKEYIKTVPESEKLSLESYVNTYVKIFLTEEEIGIKEKFLEVLKNEITDSKLELEVFKQYININYEDISVNTYSNLCFEDVLNILYGDIDFTKEEQLNYMQEFYFHNIRDIEKEHNFLIEVNNIYKSLEESEEGVPTGLIEFVEFINNIYYD